MRYVAAAVLLACGLVVGGGNRGFAEEPPSLEPVKWMGPGTSYAALRGKSVLLLVYATWCPICNGWSGEMLGQLKEAIQGKPLVVLAIFADPRHPPKIDYLAERKFVGPNILHGYDVSMPKRLGFDSELWKFALIDPKGQLVKKGEAGSFFGGEKQRQFALAKDLAANSDLGEFSVLSPDLPESVAGILWPLELGAGTSEASLLKARKQLDADAQAKFNAAVHRYLQRQDRRIEELSQGEIVDQLEAYEKASALAASFKNAAEGKKARQLLNDLVSDPQFKKELAAKQSYEKSVQQAQAQPNLRNKLMQAIAKRFKGTHYGELAAKGPDKQ
jgi:hypothetical protein